jgi:autotransporter translocation and assembly factor TamB
VEDSLKRWPFRLLVAGAVCACAIVLACALFGGALLRAGVRFGGSLLGYAVSYGSLENHAGRLTIVRPDVAGLHSEPLFTAGRIDVAYSLRDVFGSAHPFGISGIEIDRPKITIVHHRDGSYNFNLPKSNPNQPQKPFSLPQIRLVIKDGSVGVVDDTRIFTHSRRLALENVQVSAALEPRGLSHFAFGLAVLEDGGKFPISGRGTLDESRGYEFTRVTIKTLALAPLLNYALNSTSLYISGGVLNDVVAIVYGLPDKTGAMQRHVSVTANLDHFQPYLNGLAKPLRDGRGSLRVYDDGLTIPKLDGSIAGVPVRIAGGIYDLAKPTLRLGIAGNGDLRGLLTLNDAAKALPVSGPVAFKLFVEGDSTDPTTFASFAARRIFYNRIPLDGVHGLVALHGENTSVLETALSYDGITTGARGNLETLRKATSLDILANVAAPVTRLPYARALLGDMLVRSDAVVTGPLSNPQTTGVVLGDAPAHRLAGTFSVDGAGVGDIGPLVLAGPGGSSLYARVALDRPRGGGAAFLAANRLALDTKGVQPTLPGIPLATLPALSGNLDASVAGTFAQKHFTLGGNAHVYGARAFGYPIEDVTARFAASDPQRLAVDARYRGDLGALARAAGGKVRASGAVDVPVSVIANSANAALLQIHDARFERARVAGVSLDALSATVGLRGRAVDVYGARAELDGHEIVAQGSFGNGGVLDVSASGIDLAPLRAAGLPVRSGTVSVLASVGGTVSAPRVEAGIAASDVRSSDRRIGALALDASTALSFAGDTLRVHDGSFTAGSALSEWDGSVDGLRQDPKNANYRFAVHLEQADIGTLARIVRAPQYPEGTLQADVRVAGRGSAPAVAGRIAIPEGSVNGLDYRDASVELGGTARALHARAGSVTVGSSTLAFDADIAADAQTFGLRAPELHLSDFDDYFDRGDALGGSGAARVRIANSPNRLAVTAYAHFAHTRFRSFEIGDSQAAITTSGRTLHTDVRLGSTSGRLIERGDVTLASTAPLRDALLRTSVALETRAENIDLGVWLPAVGIVAPLEGKVNANATIRGVYPNDVAVAHGELDGATTGRIAIRTATVDARAARGRVTIARAVLAIDNLQAEGSGSLGLRPQSPVDVTVTARTADVGALAKTLTGTTYDTSGAFTNTLHVTGTALAPAARNVFDATAVRYAKYTVPHAHAEIAATRTHVELSDTVIDLTGGRLLASGAAPVQLTPFGVGPATAPVAFHLTAQAIDLGQFAAFFPKGTVAAGVLNGGVGLDGTLARPGLSGTLALSNGSFVGPQLKSKVTGAVAQVTFAGTTATLHDTSATIGGGSFTANGSAFVPDLRRPAHDLSGNLQIALDNPVLDAPQFFKGRVDGTLAIARAANAPIDVSGKVAFSSTRVPLSAVFNPNSPKTTATAAPLPVAFNLDVAVDRDVRLQGGPADVGATGNLHVGGTLAKPTVAGQLETVGGGTISFYRTFRVNDGSTLAFDPSDGVIPTVDVTATTTVPNPQTDVNLHVTGPATQLNVALTSDPEYDQSQILGLLVGAQALGAVSGVANQNGGAQSNPFQSLASGELGTLLTQNLLQPLSSQLGGALGLSDLAVNFAPGSGLDVGAKKKIFKNVNAVFAETFSYPQRQSIGLQATNSANTTAAQVTFFTQSSSNRFASVQPQTYLSSNQAVSASEPTNGDQGISFSLLRKF